NILVYCYENAAFKEERRNLANCRAGEYEGLEEKLKDPNWKPDFGPTIFNAKAGATAIGARDFLVAYNINLNTTSVRRANAIAFDIREKGRPLREGNPITGKIVKDDKGNPIYIPGTLKACKAIGWYIEEYGIAQVSINLTNINITPVHVAFEEACKKATERGLRVTGSEIVGLIPLKAMLDAGKYFLKKQKRSTGIPESEIIKIAIKSLGLDDLRPFNPKEKIIEYILEDDKEKKLINLSCANFADETSSESPAPGGGSVSALVGALGASLGIMVANLSAHKPGWDEKWDFFSDIAEKGQEIKNTLLHLVDEDTKAFNKIMEALSMPKNNDNEIRLRNEAIEKATLYAIEIPYKVMENAYKSLDIIKTMAINGNPNSISDAGVGALCASTAVSGAFMNVKINAASLKNQSLAKEYIIKGEQIEKNTITLVNEITSIVNSKINTDK
ncbi:MAG TPA: cyclodeaminase/cyclohydrolase family protein, partial [Bacteroidales bacterium]|nr:cyclodeaminase/cyclohydrolase family protein [Bacteroidales bacterium]